MEYIKCDKLFRRTSQKIYGSQFEQTRTFWSLVCEVLYKNGEMTKDEIIGKIGYCSSQSQVWSSLKYWKYIERVPRSWKLRLTSLGRNHFMDLVKDSGIDIGHNLEREGWIKNNILEERVRTMGKDF